MHRAAHNTWLSVTVELGVVGLTLFTLMLGASVYQVSLQPLARRLMWIATIGALLIGILVHNWEQRELTWLILGLAVASSSFTGSTPIPTARRVPGWEFPARQVMPG